MIAKESNKMPYYERPSSIKKLEARNYIENGVCIISDNKGGKYILTTEEFEKAKNYLWVKSRPSVSNRHLEVTLTNYIGRNVVPKKIGKNLIECPLCGDMMHKTNKEDICPSCVRVKNGLISISKRIEQRNFIRDGVGIVSDRCGLEWIVPIEKFDQVKDTIWHNNGNGDAINGTRTVMLRDILGQTIKEKRKAFKLVEGEFKYYPCIEDLVIYRATSPSGKCYIGMTNNFESRKRKHEKDSHNRNGTFHCALNKYGFDSFHWEILHVCNERSEAAKLEQLEIINNDSFRNGYNMTTGGEGVSGLPRDPEVDKRRSQTRSRNMGCKPVNVFKKEDLEYVGTWEMKSECEKDLGFSKGRISKHFYKSSKAIGEYYVTVDSIESVFSRKMELLQWINTSENKGKPKWNKGIKYTPEQCQRIFENRGNKLKERDN